MQYQLHIHVSMVGRIERKYYRASSPGITNIATEITQQAFHKATSGKPDSLHTATYLFADGELVKVM
jgi:hypothetical protein